MSQRRIIPFAAAQFRTCLPRSFTRRSNNPLAALSVPASTSIIGSTETPSHVAWKPHRQHRSLTTSTKKESPFATTKRTKSKKRRKFLAPKAAVQLTPKARAFFKLLLESPPRPDIVGVMLNLSHSTSGQPRMVFTFDFVSQDQISEDDEGVSLEVLQDGTTPKPPKDSLDDGLPKLYVNHNGFMKALGCTLDVDIEKMQPILYDSEGNIKDPNVT